MLRAVLTDVDGTLTDPSRRIDTRAVGAIRDLVDRRIPVILASGNTACFMDALCRMVGTDGTFIAENGGVYRVGYPGELRIRGNQEECWEAFALINNHFSEQGVALELFSPTYRFADVAFARTVNPEEVREIIKDIPVEVIDTGYAIHLQSPDISKGTALKELAAEIGIPAAEFLAIGDSLNDVGMLREAGVGAVVANAHDTVKSSSGYVAEKKYGEGFLEIVEKYRSYFLAR